MPTTSDDMRLPSYEGHLIILNQATLPDMPQTSSCTAWTEKWCSLEDGKLFVYPDRTAAIINTDEADAVIDVRTFTSIQVSKNTPGHHHYELMLSAALPKPSTSTLLSRPKSVINLNRPPSDQALRRDTSDPRAYPPRAYNNRIRAQPRLSNDSATSAHTDILNLDPTRRKGWSRFTSGSQRPGGSNASSEHSNSLRAMSSLHFRQESASSTAYSISDSRASTDLAPSVPGSPRTPLSPASSASPDCIPIRVASADALVKWVEAFSLTIKMHSQASETPSCSAAKQHRKALLRPSLCSLPGFHLPKNLQASPVFSGRETTTCRLDDEVTSTASHERRASTTSFAHSPEAPQDLLPKTGNGFCVGSTQPHPYCLSTGNTARGEHAVISDPDQRRQSILYTPTSITFQACSDSKALKRDRTHKRSISIASSSFSFSASRRLSGDRRNSLSAAQLLPLSNSSKLPAQAGAASSAIAPEQHAGAHQAVAAPSTGDVSRNINARPGDGATSRGSSSATRHRRSGSLLQIGSSRVLAWRDTFKAGNASDVTESHPGLGLLFDNNGHSDSSQAVHASNLQSDSKTPKRLPRFRSFLFLPTNKTENKGGSFSPSAPFDNSTGPSSSPSPRFDTGMITPPEALPPSKGMPKSTSLLSLTKNALSSMRAKSSTRHNVKTVFASAEHIDSRQTSMESTTRTQPSGFDFSYELVGPTRHASPTVFDSASTVSYRPRISLASAEYATRGAQSDRTTHADLTMADCTRHSFADDVNDTSSPGLPVERILPPEHMISTFDQLRAADPTGRSCDWLDRIETATRRRGSIDWSASHLRPCRPSLRTAASHSYMTRDGSMVTATSPRLRSSISAWDLPAAAPSMARETTHIRRETSDTLTRQSTEDAVAGSRGVPRSLPAPPRAHKRRARVSSTKPSLLPPAELASTVSPTKGRPLTDVTNVSPSKRRDDLPKMVQKLGLGSPSRSPRKRGLGRRPSVVSGVRNGYDR